MICLGHDPALTRSGTVAVCETVRYAKISLRECACIGVDICDLVGAIVIRDRGSIFTSELENRMLGGRVLWP